MKSRSPSCQKYNQGNKQEIRLAARAKGKVLFLKFWEFRWDSHGSCKYQSIVPKIY